MQLDIIIYSTYPEPASPLGCCRPPVLGEVPNRIERVSLTVAVVVRACPRCNVRHDVSHLSIKNKKKKLQVDQTIHTCIISVTMVTLNMKKRRLNMYPTLNTVSMLQGKNDDTRHSLYEIAVLQRDLGDANQFEFANVLRCLVPSRM